MLSRKQQADFEAMCREVADRVKAGEFPNSRSLAVAYGREQSWPAFMMHTCVERFGLMSKLEWEQGFTQRFAKVHRWQCEACGHRGKLKLVQSDSKLIDEPATQTA